MHAFAPSNVRRALFHLTVRGMQHFLTLAALLCCLPCPAVAHDASVVGTITDPTRSVVPSAKITITNIDTGLTRTSLTK